SKKAKKCLCEESRFFLQYDNYEYRDDEAISQFRHEIRRLLHPAQNAGLAMTGPFLDSPFLLHLIGFILNYI
ncbi:MAG: hypothetical protein ACE5HI_16795, partial [bacterium]